MLCIFPILLTGAASRWLRNEPAGLITTWEILKGKFLSKYCPPSRTAKRMDETNNFQQDMQEVIMFYKGSEVPTRQILDSKGGVPTMKADDAKKAIQEMKDNKMNQTSAPFPLRLKEYGYDKDEVLKGLKQLQVNSAECATRLKRLLKEKSRIEEEIKVTTIEDYSTIKDDLPLKEKDPGSFTLPCKINDICFNKALVDLRASISIMPYSTFTNLGLGELAPTKLIIDLADKTIKHPKDVYRDNEMSDVIFGKPFCRDACVEARRFDGFITIHNGNDNVTYQMAQSHPRFKHISNKQCNKIRRLLMVSARDKLEGNSHSYQKLKGFYKGVSNLGPDYIKDEKIFEWLTRRHVIVHVMN
uniref:Retrotransposon gag domain-containing protein n=1 Tax=Tanacetum cinerariifolium TaxID=118510 RepID=A0A6L2K5G0_TANCI|nr:hypothetical protein [Tanacetum cinerariifolium]